MTTTEEAMEALANINSYANAPQYSTETIRKFILENDGHLTYTDGRAAGFEACKKFFEENLMTEDEHLAMKQSGELANTLGRIVAHGEGHQQDIREMVKMIHDIQRAVMAQAACRAYPDKYRLLGAGSLDKKEAASDREPIAGGPEKSVEEFRWFCGQRNCRIIHFMSPKTITNGRQHSERNCPECNIRSWTMENSEHEHNWCKMEHLVGFSPVSFRYCESCGIVQSFTFSGWVDRYRLTVEKSKL